MTPFEQIKRFYQDHLPAAEEKEQRLVAPCPFCESGNRGRIVVQINPQNYFRGHFQCSQRCVPGGFHFYFGRLMGIAGRDIPGWDPDAEAYVVDVQYPSRHLGKEINKFTGLMGESQRSYFDGFGVARHVLEALQVGFNGRYLVFPYYQESGLAYSARCVMPHNEEDHFWHGDETFFEQAMCVYNVQEIERCRGGALFVTEGELNLLILKSLGYPAIAVPATADLAALAPQRLAELRHIFLLVANTPEAHQTARGLATHLGFKARILSWPAEMKRGEHLQHLAVAQGESLGSCLKGMIRESHAFSPFASPQKERRQLTDFLSKEQGKALLGIETGFAKLDRSLDGLRGINILGGPPKAGKSCFFMQISTQIARGRVPVIYYDFENGRQKIYLRTLVRISGLPEKMIRGGGLSQAEDQRFQEAWGQFEELLTYFRVVSDRQLNPETMRRHIDFLQHETGSDDLLIVLDSLHKLPFKSLTERRTGIDFWLRQIEAIRDEHHVSFLVISELTRGKGGGYGESPDMSSFKASGDIEYSADNAMVLMPGWDPLKSIDEQQRVNTLWVVASRESNPGKVADYRLDYPYWRFIEQ